MSTLYCLWFYACSLCMHCLGVPGLLSLKPIYLDNQLGLLPSSSIFYWGTLQVSDYSSASMPRFQPRFLGGVPAFQLNFVTCSLGFLGSVVSCKQFYVGFDRHITVFFNGEGDYVEV